MAVERVPPSELPRASSADADLRARALQLLLPPLIHRLNNALAVLQGVHELGARADVEERELARTRLAHVELVLARVALLAREPPELARQLSVDELRTGLELLLRPLAESRGVALVLALDAEGTLDVDGRFEGLVLAAVCELVARRRTEAGPRPRVLVRARPSGDGAHAALRLALGSSALPSPSPALDALAAHARDRGWGCASTRATRAVGLRLVVPVRDLQRAAAPAPPRPARVLLLAPRGEERELVELLLREHGFGVLATDRPPAGGVFDGALLDARLEAADPGLAARLAERYALARVVPYGPKPRPDELLRALTAPG